MTLFFSAAMLRLIGRLAKGEEKNMMFARVFSLASNVGFWIGIVRIAVLNRSGFLMFFYITGAMLSYTAMVFAMPHKKEQISRQHWKDGAAMFRPPVDRVFFCFKQKFIKSYTRSRSSPISSFAAAFWCCRGLMIRQISRLGASSMSGIRQTVRLFKASRASSSG